MTTVPKALVQLRPVLIMDDDEMIRVMAAILVKRLGFRATTCANGEEAIVQA
jgi:CheY-like chemotaxis protein